MRLLSSPVTVIDLVIESAHAIPNTLDLTADAATAQVKATAIDRNGFLVAPDATISNRRTVP